MNKIVEFGNSFDIGLFFMPPSNLNEEYSLGNKIFQYIQSRLALAISPLPEMKNLVDTYNLGIVSDNFDPKSLAKKLNELTVQKIQYYKKQSHKHARELSSSKNKEQFLKIISDLMN